MGSFDPITFGHIDIINRSCKLVDILYVSPAFNSNKNFMFTLEERKSHLEKIFFENENIKIITFSNLLSDYVAQNNITFIIKGLRNTLDFEKEYAMSQINKKLNNCVETLFIPSNPEFSFISSTLIKEIYYNCGNLHGLVPNLIIDEIRKKKGKVLNNE